MTAIPASMVASEATQAPQWTRRRRLALALGVSLMAGQHPATAQLANSHDVTAGVVYNFAKFRSGPWKSCRMRAADLCIADSVRVVKALEAASWRPGGRRTHPRDPDRRTGWKLGSCHLVYAGGVDARRGATLIENLKGASCSHQRSRKIAVRGGTANLFVEKGRMRFAVNMMPRGARLRLIPGWPLRRS